MDKTHLSVGHRLAEHEKGLTLWLRNPSMMILIQSKALSSFSTLSRLRAVDIKDDSCGFRGSVLGSRCRNASSVFRKRYNEIEVSIRLTFGSMPVRVIFTCSGCSLKKTTGGPVCSNIAVMGGMRVLRKTPYTAGSRVASALSRSSDAEI
jgi:hypothetical protein